MVPPHIYRRGIQDEHGLISADVVDKYRSRIEDLFKQGFIDQEVINILIKEGLDETTSKRLVSVFQYEITESISSQSQKQRMLSVIGYAWILFTLYLVVTGKWSFMETISNTADVIELIWVISGVLFWIVTKLKIH